MRISKCRHREKEGRQDIGKIDERANRRKSSNSSVSNGRLEAKVKYDYIKNGDQHAKRLEYLRLSRVFGGVVFQGLGHGFPADGEKRSYRYLPLTSSLRRGSNLGLRTRPL